MLCFAIIKLIAFFFLFFFFITFYVFGFSFRTLAVIFVSDSFSVIYSVLSALNTRLHPRSAGSEP